MVIYFCVLFCFFCFVSIRKWVKVMICLLFIYFSFCVDFFGLVQL